MSRAKRQELRGRIGVVVLKIFGQLPLSINRRLGRVLGRITWYRKGRSASICIENLTKCFPELSEVAVNQLAKDSLIETGSLVMEVTSIWRQPYARLAKYMLKQEGFDLLDAGLARGKGVMFIAPHLGNWEFYGVYLGRHHQATFMFAPTGIAQVDELMDYGRCHHGGQTAPATRHGVKKALADLKANRIVCILSDQVADPSGSEVVPFFGHPAQTMTLVHRLIERTDCAVVIGYAKRVENGFDLIIREASPEIGKAEIKESLTAMNKDIEAVVREVPAQYQWEYRRFKKV